MADLHPYKFIGAHVSTSGGVDQAPLNAVEIGANAFALFVKPQRQWISKPYTTETVELFKRNLEESGIKPENVLPHASYLINMATPDEPARAKSLESLIGELDKCRELGLKTLNIHPGSFLKTGTVEEGCLRVAATINLALSTTEGVTIVLENTAGQGSYLGSRFEELRLIIDNVNDKERVAVCLDTAHLYGAGFNIASADGLEKTLDEFGKIIGFDRLRGMHFNDTMVSLGSHVDRHAPIGDGNLGWDTFAGIMEDSRFDGIPLILETPEPESWADEIRRLRNI